MQITTDQNHYPLYIAFSIVGALYAMDLSTGNYWSAGFKATLVAGTYGIVHYLVDREVKRNIAMQVRNKLRGC